MGWFDSDDNNKIEEQLSIYEELLDDKKSQLNHLKYSGDNTPTDSHREQLKEQIKQIELNISQTQEKSEHELDPYEREQDFFED